MSNFSSFLPPILEITSWIHILTTQFPQISIWTDKHAKLNAYNCEWNVYVSV